MKKNLPLDLEKAYCFRREGIVSGGDFSLHITPSDVVDYYEELIPADDSEDGMKDIGAHIYFAGKKEGIAKVFGKYFYPTCEPEEFIFILNVDNTLHVTRID